MNVNLFNLAEVRRYGRRWIRGSQHKMEEAVWPSTPVFAYHGAVPARPFYLNTLFLTAADLYQQLQLLRQRFRFIHPMEWPVAAASERPAALLTFDDGFANNLHMVAPILKALQIPALFFVCGDGRADILYTDALAILQRLGPSRFVWRDEVFHRRKSGYYTGSGASLSLRLRGAEAAPIRNFIHLCRPYILRVPETYWRLMNTVELKALADIPLFCLGSHGMYHQDMRLMHPNVLLSDLRRSADYLQTVTDRLPLHLSFPFGHYNQPVLELAARAGFQYCFAASIPTGAAEKVYGRMINNPYVSHHTQVRAFARGSY